MTNWKTGEWGQVLQSNQRVWKEKRMYAELWKNKKMHVEQNKNRIVSARYAKSLSL